MPSDPNRPDWLGRYLVVMLLAVRVLPMPGGMDGLNASPRLLFIGDSLTSGWDASTPAVSYAEQVTAALGGVRLDAGWRYGWTLAWSADQMVREPPPAADVVVLELGTNDAPEDGGTEQVAAEYGWVLTAIRHTSPQARLVCLGPWRELTWLPITQVERVECAAAGGTFVDLQPLYDDMTLHGPAGRSTYHGPSDWFHPNDAGHAAIAAAVLAAIHQQEEA